jgi:hypothetical protein
VEASTGSISVDTAVIASEAGNRTPSFRVSAVRDLHERVVPFFDGYKLFGRKRAAFEVFKPLVAAVYERRHLTAEGLAEAKGLAQELARHNQRGRYLEDSYRSFGGAAAD